MVIVAATPKPVIDVEAVAEATKRGPVTIQAHGRDAFIAVDPADYRRLAIAEARRRQAATDDLLQVMGRIQQNIAESLTPDEIARLEQEIIDED